MKANELLLLNAKNGVDLEAWIDTILTQVKLIKEDMQTKNISLEINKRSKSVYDNAMVIMINQLGCINGILSVKESRNLLLNNLHNQTIADITKDIVNYQVYIQDGDYLSAKRCFLSYVKTMKIEDYNLSTYVTDNSYNLMQSIEMKSKGGYQGTDANMEIIGVNEINLGHLIKILMSYENIVRFKEILIKIKEMSNNQQQLLSDYLKPTLFNAIYEKLLKLLKPSSKEIVSDSSYMIGIESSLFYYWKHRNKFTKAKVLNLMPSKS